MADADGELERGRRRGRGPTTVLPVDLAAFPQPLRASLAAGRAVRCTAPPDCLASRADPDRSSVRLPHRDGRAAEGLIVVAELATSCPSTSPTPSRPWPPRSGLALDREALTEAFHARRSEARFQTLVQNASDVILIARPDTTITYQTPSAQRILGYEPGSLEGNRLTSLLHPNDVEQALAAYGGVAFRAGTSVTAEWRIRHGDGSWRHVEVVANNLLGDPTVEGIVLTLRDVTERKGLEEELKHQAFHDALSGLANRALVPGPPRARPGPGGAVPDVAGRPVPRPRRLQARQRQPWATPPATSSWWRWPGA